MEGPFHTLLVLLLVIVNIRWLATRLISLNLLECGGLSYTLSKLIHVLFMIIFFKEFCYCLSCFLALKSVSKVCYLHGYMNACILSTHS